MPFTHQGLQRSFQEAGREDGRGKSYRYVSYTVMCDVVLEQL
jgi:hypothetical protein